MDVLVTGATGFIGRRLVPALTAAGHDVTAVVRDPERYAAPPGVTAVSVDLLDADPGTDGADALTAALDVDAAYYLVHSMGATGDFAEKDRRAATNFTTAADAAGTGRLLYLGGLGEDADDLSEHLRSRREVERILADGDAPLTTFRAGVIIGAGGASFEVIRQLAARLPVMVTPRWVDTPCAPIAVDDVVACLAGALDHPETAGETYDLGGPEKLTYGDLLRRTRAQLGHRLLVVPVPVLSPRLSSYWLRLVTDVPLSVATPLVEGLKNPVLASDDRIFTILELERTPLEVALARALAETRGVGGPATTSASPAASTRADADAATGSAK